jgi:hypothetical protein
MGNQGSALVSSLLQRQIDPSLDYLSPSLALLARQGDDEIVGKISNFDHNYKVFLKKFVGNYFSILGNRNRREDEKIEGQLTCKAARLEIMIDSVRIIERKTCVITYGEVCAQKTLHH